MSVRFVFGVALQCSLVCAGLPSTAAHAQSVLQVDFNFRTSDTNTLTAAGFESMVLDDEGADLGEETNATVRTFGPHTVTLAGGLPSALLGDRLRTTPTNTTTFTEELLLRDFVFGRTDGLDLRIDGLTPNQILLGRIWCFDSGSGNNRVSDWFANGVQVADNYAFNGSIHPTNDLARVIEFETLSDTNGTVLIEGRYVSGTVSVFLNAFSLAETPGTPPTVLLQPTGGTRYASERMTLTAAADSQLPFGVHWLHNGTALPGATNPTLDLTPVTATNAGTYALVASNAAGSVTSDTAVVTVLAVDDINTALLGYWPLDEVNAVTNTPDATGRGADLVLTNMTAAQQVDGHVAEALRFNGTNSLLIRDISADNLAVSQHRSYTVAMWVRGPAGQRDRRVFSQGSNTNTTPILNLGTHNTAADGTLDIYIRHNGAVSVNHLHSQQTAFDNTWHHIAWVDDDGVGRMYIDGLLDPNTVTYTRQPTDLNQLSVGGIMRDTPSHWFTGRIDEVYLWGRALTGDELVEVRGRLPERLGIDEIIEVANDDVRLMIRTPETNATYRVEMKTNLTDAVWTTVPGLTFDPADTNRLETVLPMPVNGREYFRIGAEFQP